MLRPTVDVTVALDDLAITTKPLIDTGSPRSIFPRGVGDLLAVEFPTFAYEATKRITVLGRDWPAITETVTLRLDPFDADLTWDAEIDFLLDAQLPFALLGYEGFLNRWAVTFNGAYGYFLIEAAEDQEEQQDPSILEELRRRHPDLL